MPVATCIHILTCLQLLRQLRGHHGDLRVLSSAEAGEPTEFEAFRTLLPPCEDEGQRARWSAGVCGREAAQLAAALCEIAQTSIVVAGGSSGDLGAEEGGNEARPPSLAALLPMCTEVTVGSPPPVEFSRRASRVPRRAPVGTYTMFPLVRQGPRDVTYTGAGVKELFLASGIPAPDVPLKDLVATTFANKARIPRAGHITSVSTDGRMATFSVSVFRDELDEAGIAQCTASAAQTMGEVSWKWTWRLFKSAWARSLDPSLAGTPLYLWSGAVTLARLARALVARAAVLRVPVADLMRQVRFVAVDPGVRELVTVVSVPVDHPVMAALRGAVERLLPGCAEELDRAAAAALTPAQPPTTAAAR